MNFLPPKFTRRKIPARDRVLLGLWLSLNRGLKISSVRNFLSPGYSPANVYGLLSKMAADGLILPLSGGNYRLAPGGLRTLKEAFPVLYSAVNEKFFYCLVAAGGIGLDRRYRTRRLFDRWLVGRLCRGVYLTPFKEAAAEFKRQTGLLVGSLDLGSKSGEVAEEIWHLRTRNRSWRLLADRLCLSPEARRATKAGRPQALEDFIQMLVSEPRLPADLLPKPYWLELAKKRAQKIAS